MSSNKLDYWPFDYKRYFREILPALQQMAIGNVEPARKLLEMAEAQVLQTLHECWPRIIDYGEFVPVLISHPELRRSFARTSYTYRLEQQPWSWDILHKILPFLANKAFGQKSTLAAILHLNLLYALCSVTRSDAPFDFCLAHEESIWAWQEYAVRDTEARRVWDLFEAPIPENIVLPLELPKYREYPRALDPYLDDVRTLDTPMGFITEEQTRRLPSHLPRHSSPFLVWACMSAVERWMEDQCRTESDERVLPVEYVEQWKYLEEHTANFWWEFEQDSPFYQQWARANPEEAGQRQRRALELHWKCEDELLRRIKYALSHGWGMLMCYES